MARRVPKYAWPCGGAIWGTWLPLADFGASGAQGPNLLFPIFRARSGARTDEVEFRQENRSVGGF